MSAVRQDAWSADDDLILAEVTLRHIREGSTQLAAFEEVGDRIGRTAAACGFRWNSCVRKKYEAAIQIAKAQRQKRNKMKRHSAEGSKAEQFEPATIKSALEREDQIEGRSADSATEESISIDAVIRFLRQWKGTYQDVHRQIKSLERELKEKSEELTVLKKENEKLKKEVNEVQSDYRVVNDDYKALIQIMDRARKMAFLVEQDDDKAKFKMDANGNLERIE
jgi:prespore-specific regulator